MSASGCAVILPRFCREVQARTWTSRAHCRYTALIDLRRRWRTCRANPTSRKQPFQINVADRVKRLPPYLFGKINELKYDKRRAGVDIIDLGMGNPTDAPEPQVIDKLCEAARDERNHRYSVSQRPPQPAPRGGRAATSGSTASSSTPRPKSSPASARRKSSATCAWPCSGRATPPSCRRRRFPIHVYAVALAVGQRHQPRLHRARQLPLQRRPHLPSSSIRGPRC